MKKRKLDNLTKPRLVCNDYELHPFSISKELVEAIQVLIANLRPSEE